MGSTELTQDFIKNNPSLFQKLQEFEVLAMPFIAKFEGCKLTSYRCSAGVWTIGFGHTKTAHENHAITFSQACSLFIDDIEEHSKELQQIFTGYSFNDFQKAALLSFVFNLGMKNFKNSTLFKKIKYNSQNFSDIEKEWMRWNKVGKTVLYGLTQRRKQEYQLYCKQSNDHHVD